MDTTFPFAFFGHGSGIDLDRIGKHEELFIWLTRAPSAEERAKIADTAPAPVRRFRWIDRFAWFGSAGDTFDHEVVAAYSPKKARRVTPAALRAAAPRFLDAFEAWARAVHAISPIAFLAGPHMVVEEDEWGRASAARLPEAIALVLAHEDGTAASPILRALGARVLNAGVKLDGDTRRALVEALFGADGIHAPYEHLSTEESVLLANAKQVTALLHDAPMPERRASFERLSPYVRLAYFASYAALDAIVPAYGDELPAEVSRLSSMLPSDRAPVGACLVTHLANALCHVAPAFTARDERNAPLSAAVMEVAAASKDAAPTTFINGSMFWLWAKQAEKALALTQRGLERFPTDLAILRNAVAAATELERLDLAAELSARAARAETAPDPARVTNQTQVQIKKGDLAGALKTVRDYFERGGADDPRVWTNLLYCHIQIAPGHALHAKTQADRELDRALALAAGNSALRRSTPTIENLASALTNHSRVADAIAVLERHLDELPEGEAGDARLPNLMHAYTWAGLLATDDATCRRVKDRFEAVFARHRARFERQPGALENVAAMYSRFGEREAALQTLRILKAARYPSLATLRRDPYLKALHGDPEFEAVFA